MAHSYVEFRGHGFLPNDIDLVVVASLLLKEFRSNPAGAPRNVAALLDWWDECLKTSGPGCIDLKFDEFLTDVESVGYLCTVISAALKRLGDYGERISADQLNEIVDESEWLRGDRKTKDFHGIVARFQKLLGCSA